MDTMEITKIAGGLIGALLIYLGVQFFAEMIFHDSHDDGRTFDVAQCADEVAGHRSAMLRIL